MARMYNHYKQHKRGYWTNCNDVYCKTHYSCQLNWNRYMYLEFTTCSVCGKCGHECMTYNMEALMLKQEIKELTWECGHTKPEALSLPPYHPAPEWATGSSAIAVNTSWDERLSPEQQCPLGTAAIETTAMRKGTSNTAEPASTLYQHAVHMKQGRRT